MRLAIVGSRNFKDYDMFKKAIFKVLNEWNIELIHFDSIVSGGANTLAEKFADEYQVDIKIFLPNWNLLGKKAGILRNTDIINYSTHVIAFPSHSGKGTQDSISKAKAQNKKLKILYID